MSQILDHRNSKIAIVGLGYVGLPLAVSLGTTKRCCRTSCELERKIIGFDINTERISELKNNIDRTNEIEPEVLESLENFITLTSNTEDLLNVDIFIVTVPTPIDKRKNPDLTPLEKASEMIGNILAKGDKKERIVIYESTVYPGVTEEFCARVIEKYSGKKFNRDFFCGYSPERINPGDKEHRLEDIIKVTSGSNNEVATIVDNLYGSIIKAGTHKARSIKVAEAAKVIENTQRDINIALMNELAIIFNRLDIDTKAVLDAASTKWNFLKFKPGLVGGHCIGVDPYYLTYCAQELGYEPRMILSGRQLNDSMGTYIAGELMKKMSKNGMPTNNSRILIMGLSFKENCPDLRNTGVISIINELKEWNCIVDVYDPIVSSTEAQKTYGISTHKKPSAGIYDSVIIAVAHDKFKRIGEAELRSYCKGRGLIFDVKHLLEENESEMRL